MIDFFTSSQERFTKQELTRFVLHTLIALACVPIYMSRFYALFGLVTGTVLLYFIFRPKREYLLPLMIHTMWGSQQRYIMLAGCFVYALVNFGKLRRVRLQGVFLLYLILLPFFIWYTWKRYVTFGGGIGMGGTFNGLGYYLAFATFFWVVISQINITRETFVGSIVIGFLVFVNFALHLPFTRMIFWSADFMPVFLLWVVINSQAKNYIIDCILALVCLAGLVLGFTGRINLYVSFTQVGVMALAAILVLSAKFNGGLFKFIKPILFFVVSLFMTVYTINQFGEKGRIEQFGRYEDIKITGVDAVKEKVLIKVFNDRAPLWTATWDSIKQQAKKDPIWIEPVAMTGGFYTGDGRMVEIDLMAHNIMLLLLQEYGWLGGLGLYLIYITLMSRKEVHEVIRKESVSYYSLIGACCFAHGVVGGYTGQYVMNVDFSFILFGFLGCVFAHFYRISRTMRQFMP